MTHELPPLPALPPGRYRHYKGGEYEVIGVARHSESLEPMVLYRPLYNATGHWVRPLAMFLETVEHEGTRQPRFRRTCADASDAVPGAPADAARRVREARRSGDLEGARRLALALVAEHPGQAELQYEAACVHDQLGLEAEAVPFYEAALALGLPPQSLRGAYLGLGSTYRTLGRYEQAEATLRAGLAHFADAAEFLTFLAMTLHNRGQSRQAVEMLLGVVADTSADAHVVAYRKAIRFYAQDVERTWS
jgi:tetratricopeptide (TPR) repeat protein